MLLPPRPTPYLAPGGAPARPWAAPQGVPPTPSAPKDPRPGRRPSRSWLPGVPTDTPSPEPLSRCRHRFPQSRGVPTARALRHTGRPPPRGSQTAAHPRPVARTATSDSTAPPDATQVLTGKSQRLAHLRPPPAPCSRDGDCPRPPPPHSSLPPAVAFACDQVAQPSCVREAPGVSSSARKADAAPSRFKWKQRFEFGAKRCDWTRRGDGRPMGRGEGGSGGRGQRERRGLRWAGRAGWRAPCAPAEDAGFSPGTECKRRKWNMVLLPGNLPCLLFFKDKHNCTQYGTRCWGV